MPYFTSFSTSAETITNKVEFLVYGSSKIVEITIVVGSKHIALENASQRRIAYYIIQESLLYFNAVKATKELSSIQIQI